MQNSSLKALFISQKPLNVILIVFVKKVIKISPAESLTFRTTDGSPPKEFFGQLILFEYCCKLINGIIKYTKLFSVL